MKIQKILALLTAVTVSVGCLAGCGQQVSNNETESGSQESKVESVETVQSTGAVEEKSLFNVGTLPIVNEPITLKVLTVDLANKAYATADECGYWEWLSEKTGITFEVESYAKEELASKLPLIMATPDQMPDLFFNVGFSAADILNYGQNGQILMMDEYIEEYGSNIQKAFDEVTGVYGGAVAADGHIYSIPNIVTAPASVIYVMNSRFMENSGVTEEPSTLEDLYEVFKAIRVSDANGDGTVGNEICWSTSPDNFKRQALSMVGIPCYWPWEGCIFDDKDGEVYFVPTSEEYKYLLSWLRTFYKEGMIDQELFTQTGEQRTAKIKSDLVFMSHTYDDPEQSNYQGRSGAFWLKAPLTSAVSDEPIVTSGSMYQPDMGVISAYTEYPEVCMLLLDYLYDDEASKVAYAGIEGTDYIIDADGLNQAASEAWTKLNGPTTITLSNWTKNTWFPQTGTTLAKAGIEYRAKYSKMGWQNYLKFNTEESEAINVLGADLGLYCDDFYVGVITGNYDLEKDWDAYVANCKSMKVDELTTVYQAAYNRFFGIE